MDRQEHLLTVKNLPSVQGVFICFPMKANERCPAHARRCCVDFFGCSAGQMAPKIPEIFVFLVHNSIRLCL